MNPLVYAPPLPRAAAFRTPRSTYRKASARLHILLIFMWLSGLGASFPNHAGDPLRELLTRQQLERRLEVGKIINFSVSGEAFWGVRTQSPVRPLRGGVLLLHDRDGSPDAAGYMHSLRTHLPQHAWETLAIQLPLNFRDAPPKPATEAIREAVPRVRMALQSFKQNNIANVVLLGEGDGARLALDYFVNFQEDALVALIMLELPPDTAEENERILEQVTKLSKPTLEVFDRTAIEEARLAKQRKLARQSDTTGADPRYQQIGIGDRGSEDWIAARVRSWINRHVSGTQINAARTPRG
jgi:hypothetical protein